MDLHLLNKEQKIAVEHQKGPLLVLSGAGTGKTRVLTSRFVYIVKHLNIDFHKIIAVTFTNSNLRIYINGQLSVDETASISNWTFTWSDQGNSTNTNLIGAVAPASGVTKFFSGKIDDFAMWSRALTANEVAELYDL